jgi:hypothetical protein
MRGSRQQRQGDEERSCRGSPSHRVALSLLSRAWRLADCGAHDRNQTGELFPRVTHKKKETVRSYARWVIIKNDLPLVLPPRSSSGHVDLMMAREIHHQLSRQAKHERETSTLSAGGLSATGRMGRKTIAI